MRSIHTPVGWFAIALPPPATAFARQIGLLYTPAPEYGLSARPPLLDELAERRGRMARLRAREAEAPGERMR
jgi:hypothetical protein